MDGTDVDQLEVVLEQTRIMGETYDLCGTQAQRDRVAEYREDATKLLKEVQGIEDDDYVYKSKYSILNCVYLSRY